MSPKAKRVAAIICAVILGLSLTFFSVDFLRAKRRNQPPLFCVPAIKYGNGSTDYYGLFYKVWEDYDPFEDETRYYMGFWLIPKSFNL